MSQRITQSYRHILRNLLRGVNYATKARVIAVKQLRAAYRDPGAVYDEEGIKRTVWFLKAAGKTTGIEHKILKNLIEVRRIKEERYGDWAAVMRRQGSKGPWKKYEDSAFEHYDATVAMLNKTMGLCLR